MRLLLVEDEPDLADSLAEGLRREGYLVDVARTGTEALAKAATADVDIVVLDRDLPGLSGDAVCRTLRSEGYPVRILMLTAAGSLDDRIEGLDLGADDYLAKPFAYLELLARLRALGRRGSGVAARPSLLEVGDLVIDGNRRLAERRSTPLRLTPKEFAVLESLAAARGGWMSATELLDAVWEDPDERTRGVVKIVVHTLRRKLGAPDPIESRQGYGYRLVAP
jgi:DNA-binding response OmpR family regulator